VEIDREMLLEAFAALSDCAFTGGLSSAGAFLHSSAYLTECLISDIAENAA
jgi:hypothetical protein